MLLVIKINTIKIATTSTLMYNLIIFKKIIILQMEKPTNEN
jgi:hypothetical protein